MSAPDPGQGRPTPTPESQPAHSPDTRPDPTTEPLNRTDQGTAQRRQFGTAMLFSGWLSAAIENAAATYPGQLGVTLLPTPDSSAWPVIELRVREGTLRLTVAYHEAPTRFGGPVSGSRDGGDCGA